MIVMVVTVFSLVVVLFPLYFVYRLWTASFETVLTWGGRSEWTGLPWTDVRGRVVGLYPEQLNQYRIYGEPIYSSVNGTVVRAVGRFSDLTPGNRKPETTCGCAATAFTWC